MKNALYPIHCIVNYQLHDIRQVAVSSNHCTVFIIMPILCAYIYIYMCIYIYIYMCAPQDIITVIITTAIMKHSVIITTDTIKLLLSILILLLLILIKH